MISKTHYYFLLQTSPWPFMLSAMSFNLMTSFFFFMKFNDFFSFFISLLIMTISSFSWWINYSFEFNLEGKNSLNLEKGVKMSMILFISSEIFFFFSFFWSYFHFFLSPSMELGLSWPPIFIESFDYLGVPLINTLILMGSGLTVTLSHYYLIKGNKMNSSFWLISTIVLGLLFSYFQLMEYKSSFFSISDGSFGSTFFVLTGFHGIHVLIGSMFLLTTLMRAFFMNSASNNFLSFELASWYWHFVDVVWIFLYCFLYYLVD